MHQCLSLCKRHYYGCLHVSRHTHNLGAFFFLLLFFLYQIFVCNAIPRALFPFSIPLVSFEIMIIVTYRTFLNLNPGRLVSCWKVHSTFHPSSFKSVLIPYSSLSKGKNHKASPLVQFQRLSHLYLLFISLLVILEA